MAERLYRSRHDRMLAGVAAGVADALDADPSLVRIAWALLVIFTGGIAFVVYVVMAIVVPEAPAGSNAMTPPPAGGEPGAASQSIVASGSSDSAGAAPVGAPAGSDWSDDRSSRRAARRARRSASGGPGRGGLIAGLILIVVGGFFLAREFVPWFDGRLWWPVGLIGLGGLLLFLALVPGRSSE